MDISQKWLSACARELKKEATQIARTVDLLEAGGTVPFIARYRKEQTGSLDEIAIVAIKDSLENFRELEKRKANILASLQERDLLDGELQAKISGAENLQILEDIYLPFRQKRQTRAMKARQQGLEPLAKIILKGGDALKEAAAFVNSDVGISNVDEALCGARDIIAEQATEREDVRARLRKFFREQAIICSQVVEKKREEAVKFRDYFNWQEPVKKLAGHRLLAILRGSELKLLRVTLRPPRETGIAELVAFYGGRGCRNSELLAALEDGYTRLLEPSLENELTKRLKEKADEEAISVFGANLKKLLLAPPLGQQVVIALDPGFRTGAKLACLDGQGNLLYRDTIYPTHGSEKQRKAAELLQKLIVTYGVQAIAIGSGTAGRETEDFVRGLDMPGILVTLVNEDGASVYSASEVARAEFPDEDITTRGAVSIGRRLQDPLAELVKIDPKSIGVGQYQHDVDQQLLRKRLEEVVVSCVNHVGVELNSASAQLLGYVAGLGPALAGNIVSYRRENGPFASRKELLKVPRLGKKAYEQCAGFLRIRNGQNPLDNSGVHPERYELVKKMARDYGADVATLMGHEDVRRRVDISAYVSDDIGRETLNDIMRELAAPGRDPREGFSVFRFDERVHAIEDVQEGMILPAIITNVTKFGAFADIGVKQDGLIHISQLADRFVKDPAEVVSARDQVRVKVLEVDLQRKRIALSLRV